MSIATVGNSYLIALSVLSRMRALNLPYVSSMCEN